MYGRLVFFDGVSFVWRGDENLYGSDDLGRMLTLNTGSSRKPRNVNAEGDVVIQNFFEKLFVKFTPRIQELIQHEFERRDAESIQDLGRVLQRRAAESSADYIEKRMKGVDSTYSKYDLLERAIHQADLTSGRLLCEFGVFSGDTINHIASRTENVVYGFDSFEGLPERWRDGFGTGCFKLNALPKVRANVTLVQGWFDATLPQFVKEHKDPIGFLHIDCDLYSSTKTIFENLSSQIGPGCVIVFDEYFNYPSWEEGEYKAFQEFVKDHHHEYEYIGYNRKHEQVAVKIKA